MKLIILEGVDGVGKTTIAKKLEHLYLNSQYLHCGPAPTGEQNSMLHYWQNRFREALTKMNYNGLDSNAIVILDRSPLSNFVYGNLKNDQATIAREELLEFFSWLVSKFSKTLIIFLSCSEKELAKRYKKTGESYVDAAQAMSAQAIYESALGNLMTFRIDNGKLSLVKAEENASIMTILNLIQKTL